MRMIGVIVVGALAGVATADPKACAPSDFDDHSKKGLAAYDEGSYKLALTEWEAALACKPDDGHTIALAYAAACGAESFKRAKFWFDKTPGDHDHLAQICLRHGFDPRK